MAENYVSAIFIELERPEALGGGVVSGDDITEFSTTVTKERTPVNTLNRRRTARGFRTGTKEVTAEITVAIPEAGLAFPWLEIHDQDLYFQIYTEREDGGKRRHLVDCQVNDIEESANPDGEVELKVSIKALDERAAR